MRRLPLVIALAGVVLMTTAIALGCGSSGDDSSGQITLDGVSAEDLEGGGVVLERPMSGDRASVDATQASDVARSKHAPGATVREVVLARMCDDLGLREKQLVWVVSFDPASIVPMPPLGPGPASSPVNLETLEVVFALVFVDADSGEIIHNLQRTRGTPLKD